MRSALTLLLFLALGVALRACPEDSVLRLVLAEGHRERVVPVCGGGDVRFAPYTRELLALLREPAFRAEAAHLAAQAPRTPVTLRVQVRDDGRTLVPGETLRVPRRTEDGGLERGEHTVVDGETLEILSRKSGWSIRQLVLVNDERFQVTPVTRVAGEERSVLLGEAGLATAHRGTPELTRRELVALAVLHELGHVAEIGGCPKALSERYGPDLRHFDLEVLVPVAAFAEGWADWQAFHLARAARRRVENLPTGARIETRGKWPVPGRYSWIMPWELTAADLLATKEGVTRVLTALEAAIPGGRGVLEAAFQEIRAEKCRHLGTFLGRLPEEHRGALRGVLMRELRTLATEEVLGRLLRGELPNGGDGISVPRRRSYSPAPPRGGAQRSLRVSWHRVWRKLRWLQRTGETLPELGRYP